ncbi:hypothetical protein ACFL7D_06800 [candidate division KSB1 bacterium]
MFKLLKAELKYNWFYILLAVILSSALSSVKIGVRSEDGAVIFPMILMILIMIMIIGIAASFLSFRGNEKRDRFLSRLPVPVRQMAVSRILSLILPITVLFGIFYTVQYSIGSTEYFMYLSLAFSGCLFLLAFISVLTDLAFAVTGKYDGKTVIKGIMMVFVGVILLINLFTVMLMRKSGEPAPWFLGKIFSAINSLGSWDGVWIFFNGAFLLFVLDIFLYERRKTYLE